MNIHGRGDVRLNFNAFFFLTGAVHSRRPAGEDFDLIAHADHTAGAGDQVLAEIDIAVILGGAERLQRFQRFARGVLLPFFRTHGSKDTAAARLDDIKDDATNANRFPGVFFPRIGTGYHQVRTELLHLHAGFTAVL